MAPCNASGLALRECSKRGIGDKLLGVQELGEGLQIPFCERGLVHALAYLCDHEHHLDAVRVEPTPFARHLGMLSTATSPASAHSSVSPLATFARVALSSRRTGAKHERVGLERRLHLCVEFNPRSHAHQYGHSL
eukprot:TRINITY_DN2019_c0_g2_i1.p2 TRINITY_DN2019_c0_g2~~TRINITY_DN2019_c0_g2_i1.p2  ORF type:complete len:135 (+),score=15.08 TRINITY_DN2019_c0_g2_i1:587-991(+)